MYVRQLPCCDAHFSGRGNPLKLYRGPVFNHVGFGFFSDFFKRLVPFISQKVLPYVGAKLSDAGKNVISDLSEGTSFKESLKRTAKRTLESTKDDLFKKMSGSGRVFKKRCANAKRQKRSRAPLDYFSSQP